MKTTEEKACRDEMATALHDVAKQYEPRVSDYLIQRFADRIMHELKKPQWQSTQQPRSKLYTPHDDPQIEAYRQECLEDLRKAEQPTEPPENLSGQWQPISMAPRSETVLLLSKHGVVGIGQIYPSRTPPLRKSSSDPLPDESEWLVNAEGSGWAVTGGYGYPQNFTHWMPLPKPPAKGNSHA